MKFDINIKNFGKTKQAKLKVSPFTVIAGSNSSGKSFVSRALYSFFSTINQDHVTKSAIKSLSSIRVVLSSARYSLNSPSQTVSFLHTELTQLVEDLEHTINREYGQCTYIEQFSRIVVIEEKLQNIEIVKNELIKEIAGTKKYTGYLDKVSLISSLLQKFKLTINEPDKVLSESIEKGFNDALKENFQVTNLSDLKSFGCSSKDKIEFDFGSLGVIKISGESIGFQLAAQSVNDFQSLYNVVFLESPIYWKLRKPLTRAKEGNSLFRNSRRLHKENEALCGVPQYFFDMLDLLDINIKSNQSSTDNVSLYNRINDVVGGELDISESGDIFFKDEGTAKNININLTASGVTNLGIIALLLKRNVIAKGSFLFVDEPEVNLHPAWQKVMIEILYHLSQNGINVVIASHSIDMMKYIENIMSELDDEYIENHFSINHLASNGESISDSDSHPLQELSKIKEDLGAPFYNMLLEGGW